MATYIGMVQATIGSVMAFDVEGAVRNLQAGDHVFANELIATHADGAIEVEFADGEIMDLGRSSQVFLNSQFFDPNINTVAPDESGGARDAGNSFLIDGQGDDILSGEQEVSDDFDSDTPLPFYEDGTQRIDLSDVLSNPGYQLAGVEHNGHLQIQVSDSEGVIQLINLSTVAVADDAAAQSTLSQLLDSGMFNDGLS